ncbi:hypothetical protein QLQ12_26315 [Actinoplanes sp. NEAU-A12]|uniref:Sensor domain-containing protein n=1 Tax=Actinoplanes sandaracinus TaxID=3045177 RepID=A0ABT6WQX8_9ACTN|nr:hypothetical protein [Actinoplanes sandaracinus]MDI6102138.1 hypothetical protein [Actinoplanes sandaracinus]
MRTHSTRLVVGAGLLSVALTACSSGSGPGPASGSPATAAARSGPVPQTSAAKEKGIPGGALLQPDDVRGVRGEPLDQGESAHVRPLRPCGDGRYPSDESRTDAVAMRYVVPGPEGSTPTVVIEFVGLHTPGGAAAQLRDIDAALDRCPGGLGEGQRKWTVLESDDASALVRIDQRISYADEEPSTVSHFAAVATVNDAVVVVTDLGWENMGGDESLVRELIAKAKQRAGTIA